MIEIPYEMKEMVDVKEEDYKSIKEELNKIANDNKCCLIGFIASYRPIKVTTVTPTKFKGAEVGLFEEFGIEQVISEIKEKSPNVTKCFLLLNSPGGLVDSSYKIAYLLRKSFKEIVVFVPHLTLSGGTLIALAGDKIVMGPMSQLSPLDVQVEYGDVTISTTSAIRTFERMTKYFEKTEVDDAPYTLKSFAEKLDPVLMEEWSSFLRTMKEYTKQILSMGMFSSNKEEADRISNALVYDFPIHGYVINYEKAKELKLEVIEKEDKNFSCIWDIMRKWLAIYVPQSTDKHFIRYALPTKQKSSNRNSGEVKK